jgi:hypothetical protein
MEGGSSVCSADFRLWDVGKLDSKDSSLSPSHSRTGRGVFASGAMPDLALTNPQNAGFLQVADDPLGARWNFPKPDFWTVPTCDTAVVQTNLRIVD